MIEIDKWPVAGRVVHLTGGLYAVNPPRSRTVNIHVLSPETEDNVAYRFIIAAYQELFSELYNLGLKPLGVEFYERQAQVDGVEPPHIRHFFAAKDRGVWPAEDAAQTWSQIRNTATQDLGDVRLMDLCRRISFELRATTLKWFDISHAYSRTLNGVVRGGKFGDGLRFDDGNAFAVYVSVHSFLAEAATLRDYLAEFIANYILGAEVAPPDGAYVSKMSALVKELRRQDDVRHPLATYIRQSTEESAAGWLAEMSAYRDLVIHHAPADQAHGMNLMMHRAVPVSNGPELPGVAFYLPSDPFAVKRARAKGGPFKTYSDFVQACMETGVAIDKEAMHYCHDAFGRLAVLAFDTAAYSPVRPTMPHIGPDDIVSLGRVG